MPLKNRPRVLITPQRSNVVLMFRLNAGSVQYLTSRIFSYRKLVNRSAEKNLNEIQLTKTCTTIGVQVSHEKNPPTFHYTGWLIGILIVAYYNPYITG